MEDKLEMVKKMMDLEKDKRTQIVAQTIAKKGGASSGDGTMWRSATTQKQIAGYSQMVLNHHKQVPKPALPPTGKENGSQPAR